MALAGTYQHVRNENLVEYLTNFGVSEDRAKAHDARKSKLQVVVDGRKISLTSDSGAEKTTTTFIVDEEVDETMPDKVVLKSTAKLDGDILTITSKRPSGKVDTRIYKFSDAELVVTMRSDEGGPTAKRIYKRI